MTPAQCKQAIVKLSRRMEAVGRERDKLDLFIDELSTLKEDCNEAYDALITARDALSRLV